MKFNKKLLSVSITSALMLAQSPLVSAQDVGDAQAGEEPLLEVIVVKGIRGSLQKSLDIKRSSDNIIDSIVAEDIGKLPDVNVAEALQRVPGVTVGRDSGEGRRISVRGLDGSFNVTTMNGRRLATEDPGREFSYDVLASELVSQIDVNKSSQARLYEGGIGAVIDVQTYKPLHLEDGTLRMSGFAVLDELEEDVNPRLSGLYSKKFNDDSMGVLLSLNYSKRSLRQDEAKVTEYDDSFNVDLYADGNIELENGTIPRAFTMVETKEDQERYGANFAFQWNLSNKTEMNIDALYSSYETVNTQNVFGNVLDQGNQIYFEPPTPIGYNADANGNILGMEWGNDNDPDGPYTRSEFAFVENEASTFPRLTETMLVGVNLKHKFTDRLEGEVDIYHSEANRDDNGDAWVLKSRTAVNSASYDWSNGRTLPKLTFSEPLGSEFPWTVGFLENKGTDVNDKISEAKFDGVWEANGFLDVVRFGFGYSNQEKSNDVYRTTAIDTYFEGKAGDDWFGLGAHSAVIDGEDFSVEVDAISQPGDSGIPYERFRSFVVPETVFSNQVTGFLEQVPGDQIPRSWNNINITEMLSWLRKVGQVADGDNSDDFDLLSASLSPVESYALEEELTWAYIESDLYGDIGGKNYLLNLGLRVSNTEQISKGSNANVETFYGRFIDDILGVQFSNEVPVEDEKSYLEWLPSMNFSLDMTDEIVVRAAAAKVMSRAPIGDLRQALDTPNFRGGTIRAGNPDLDPFKADQYDATFEWYYSDNGALLVGAFYKDIDTFIANGERTDTLTLSGPFTCTVNFCQPGQNTSKTFSLFGPFNANGGSVKGVEFSWQSDLGYLGKNLENFGFSFNGTYADSETELTDSSGESLPLEGQSEWSYNLIGYYETDRFGSRIAYNWRDQYLLVSGANPIYHDAIGWLDASVYFNVNDNLSVNFYGGNLLDSEDKGTYGKEGGPFNDYMNFVGYTGRQYGLGISLKF